jgi:hypothetical protein
MSRHHSDLSPRQKEESHLISTLKITKTTNGWTVPSGADYMKILLIAGGGAGAPVVGGAGGGGGGSYSSKDFCVTPGDSFNIVIGQGGQNGSDGGNTILEYKSHRKTAYGGKAGVGTTGGKGGKGSHSNESGTDGKSTGEGGKTKTWRNLDTLYGSGGRGGVYTEPPLLPTARLSPMDVLQEIKSLMNLRPGVAPLIVPKGSPRKTCCDRPVRDRYRCEKKECECVPNIVIPEPSPEGSPGVQGYCEIEFYSKRSPCHERKCKKELQKIVIKDSNIEYAINPEADTVIVDTSNFEGNLVLPKGLSAGDQITIKLLHNQGLSANIFITTGGMFTLNATMPIVNLLFNGCVWLVLDSHDDVASLYPTTQECKATVVEDFKFVNNLFYGGRIVCSEDGSIVASSQPFNQVSSVTNTYGIVHVYERHDNCLKLKQVLEVDTTKNMYIYNLTMSGDGKTIVFAQTQGFIANSEIIIYTMGDDCKYTKQNTIIIPTVVGTVDLSTDANTLIAVTNSNVFIYKRSGSIWSLSDTVIPNSGVFYGAINADGTVFALTNASTDYIEVFRYQFGSWVSEYSVSIPAGFSIFYGLDISADGNTVALAQPSLNSTIIFQRTGGIWVIQ